MHLTTTEDLNLITQFLRETSSKVFVQSTIVLGGILLQKDDELMPEGAMDGLVSMDKVKSLNITGTSSLSLSFKRIVVQVISDSSAIAPTEVHTTISNTTIKKTSTTVTRSVLVRRALQVPDLNFVQSLHAALNEQWTMTESVSEGGVEINDGDELLKEGSMETHSSLDDLLDLESPVILKFIQKRTEIVTLST